MNYLRVEFFSGPVKIELIPRATPRSLPIEVVCFQKALMAWYHSIGKNQDISPDDLLAQFPTFVFRAYDFTFEIQSGGEKYPNSFSLSVFNPRGAVIDERNFFDPAPDEAVPEKWPHGAPTVDARKTSPRSPQGGKTELSFSMGPFTVVLHNLLKFEQTKLVSLYVIKTAEAERFIYIADYLWLSDPSGPFPSFLESTGVIDARKPMDYVPRDPSHPKFVPPQPNLISETEKMDVIRACIERRRKESGIIPSADSPYERSCKGMGEFQNLVEVQLVRTLEGHGAWLQLVYPEILDGAYRYIAHGIRG